MNYYQHHIGDYLTDTAHLSILEDGAYRRLMDRYYTTESVITSDESSLFRVLRAGSEAEKDAIRIVLSEFFTMTPAGWAHKRCDAEIAAFKEKSNKSVDAANKRWGKPSNADAMPTHTERNADAMPTNNHKPLTNNQEPSKSKATPAGDPFNGINPQVVADFKALRAKQRAAITKTAIDGIQREADKAGVSLEDALTICCERGWRGFKADWITQPSRASPQKSSIYEQGQANAAIAKRMIFGEENETV